jgi:hypothetical protein
MNIESPQSDDNNILRQFQPECHPSDPDLNTLHYTKSISVAVAEDFPQKNVNSVLMIWKQQQLRISCCRSFSFINTAVPLACIYN